MSIDILNIWRRELASEIFTFSSNALYHCKNVGEIYDSLAANLTKKRIHKSDEFVYKLIAQKIKDFSQYSHDEDVGKMCQNQVKILNGLQLIHNEKNRIIKTENVFKYALSLGMMVLSANLLKDFSFSDTSDFVYEASLITISVLTFLTGLKIAYNTYRHRQDLLEAKNIIVINDTIPMPITSNYIYLESTKVNEYYLLKDCLIRNYTLSKEYLEKDSIEVSENAAQLEQIQRVAS